MGMETPVFEYVTLVVEEPKEVPVLSLDGSVVGNIRLPSIFGLPVRIDLIRRAFHSAHTARIQPKGRDPLAGKRRCGHYWGIGHGVARLPRLWNGRAVFAPNVRGGRRQFAPTPLRRIHEEINWKEMKLAILSALAASAKRSFVVSRGHLVPEGLEVPIVVVDEFERLSRVRQVREVLQKLGLWRDVERAQLRTRIRAGKGKMRGRRYVTPKSILFMLSDVHVPVTRAVANLPGVDYTTPRTLNILQLAPGGVPGRLLVATRQAIETLGELYVVRRP